MKRSVLFHEIRLLELISLLALAAVVFAGCHHASTAASGGNRKAATSAAAAEGSNPANLPPLNAKEKAGTPAQGGAHRASQNGHGSSTGAPVH
ncbi:MAG TPA: hypothetical protein VFU55_07005 [Terracidiphilus sp.]|nr:hypothetical protein [Terracidiphilus sp.]